MFFHHPLRRGAQLRLCLSGGHGCSRIGRLRSRGTGRCGLINHGQKDATGDGATRFDFHLDEYTRHRRRHLEHDFVRFKVGQILVAGDGIPRTLVPGHERRISDGFG